MAEAPMNAPVPDGSPHRSRRIVSIVVTAIIAALAAAGGAALLVNIMERQQEARNPFYRGVELSDETTDPAIWGKNFPLQYDGYSRTVDQGRTRFGGSEALPRTPTDADPRSIISHSRLEDDSRLKRMWAGYSFRAYRHFSVSDCIILYIVAIGNGGDWP